MLTAWNALIALLSASLVVFLQIEIGKTIVVNVKKVSGVCLMTWIVKVRIKLLKIILRMRFNLPYLWN